MSTERKMLGRVGERLARKFLENRGYQILESNFNCPLGEIDIIAREGGVTCFVEVKTRRSSLFGLPIESIVKRKRKKMYQAAWFYIKRLREDDGDFRFDAVSIIMDESHQEATLSLDKNVFGEDLR